MRGGRSRGAARHNVAILHAGRRGCDVALRIRRAERTGASGRGVYAVSNLSVSQGSCGDMLCAAVDMFAVHKTVVRSSRHSVRAVGVLIIVEIAGASRIEIVEIGVVDVDVVIVAAAAVVPR